ncbi:hypothetical protein E4U41_005821 [Claviceps citrina]|nr:hypothetical protein E4U41_005821 [Claviceps citrina]
MVRTSLVASLLAAAASTLARGPNTKVSRTARNVVPGAYIFELADGQDAAAFEQTVAEHGTTRMKLDYDLFHGVSVQLHDVQKAGARVAKLAALPEVKAVFPVVLYDMPNPQVEWVAPMDGTLQQANLTFRPGGGKDTYSTHVMTQVDKLRAKGITGKGVRLAIIDTGLDYGHPALGGCFGKGCLVSFGYDLVGDDYAGNNTPQPDKDPMDCAGHGTHVAGIIAARNNTYGFTGTAPDVTLGAYRVFGCKGYVSNEVLIAAYNMAYQDGANIITASIGGDTGWPEEPWAVAVSRIVEKGIPCVLSAGNAGSKGLFYASGAADGHHVTAIASFDNVNTPTIFHSAKYQIDNRPEQVFGHVPSNIAKWDGVALPVWASSLDPTVKDDGCNPFPANTPDLSKYIVLIRRGTCSYDQKLGNAIAKGAKNAIVYNNDVGAGAMYLNDTNTASLNAASMTDAETGVLFINALKQGKKLTLKMASAAHSDIFLANANNTLTGGALSTFTSWGPTWEMDVKPQFGAVGGKVLSTFPRARGSYAVLSGTSMSCPQVAGIIALIHQVRGTLEPEVIENLLSANANPQLFNDGTKFYDFLAPVPQQGGGLVQAYDAAYATTLLSPSGLSFNDTDHFAKSLTFTLRNTARKAATYKITHVPAITMYTLGSDYIHPEPFPNDVVRAAATLQFSQTSITLRGGQAKTISVSATPPQGLDEKRLALWSGYIAVNGTDGASLSLPYQGLTGSLHDSLVLAPTDAWISNSNDSDVKPVATNTTFLLPGPGNAGVNDTLPQISVKLALGTSKLRINLVPLNLSSNDTLTTTDMWGVKSIGQLFGFPMQWLTSDMNNFPWDGRLASGNYAPPGSYGFVVRALRIFGDEKNKEDWDVSTTSALTIKYR